MTDMTDQGGPAASVVRVLIVDDHPVVRDGLVGMLGAEPGIDLEYSRGLVSGRPVES